MTLIKDEQEGGIEYSKVYGPDKKFSISFVKLSGDHTIPYHFHEQTETIYAIVNGKGRMIVDDQEIDVYAGLTLYIPPKSPHTIVAEKGERIDFWCKECPPDDDDFHPKNKI